MYSTSEPTGGGLKSPPSSWCNLFGVWPTDDIAALVRTSESFGGGLFEQPRRYLVRLPVAPASVEAGTLVRRGSLVGGVREHAS